MAIFGMNLLVNCVKHTDRWFQPCSLGGLLWFSYLIVKATSYFPSQCAAWSNWAHGVGLTFSQQCQSADLVSFLVRWTTEIVTNAATHLRLTRYPVCFSLLSDSAWNHLFTLPWERWEQKQASSPQRINHNWLSCCPDHVNSWVDSSKISPSK